MAVASIAPNKSGPTYTNVPARPIPPTTATRTGTGRVTVTFGTAWDYDNNKLTYELLRDGGTTAVQSTTRLTNFWNLPTLNLYESGLVPGSTHTYQIRITDPYGNTLLSPVSNTVTA
jgi:hypothetical protein